MTHTKLRHLTLSLMLLTLVTLQGCGFHLRTVSALPSSASPMFIEGLGSNDPMLQTLRDVLKEANVQLVEERTQAATRLRLRKQSVSRRVLSVDSGGKVLEYELHHSLDFDLVNQDGGELVAEQSVGVQQTYENPETEVLGKRNEENQLREDMRFDLARSITDILRAQLH